MTQDESKYAGLAWAQLLVTNAAEEPPDFLYGRPRKQPAVPAVRATTVGMGDVEVASDRRRR